MRNGADRQVLRFCLQYAVPRALGVVPGVLGVVPRVLGVVPGVLGVVPRVLGVLCMPGAVVGQQGPSTLPTLPLG